MSTAATDDASRDDGWLPGSGGIALFRRAWLPDDGTTRAVVVLAHGGLEHSARYDHLGVRLAAAGMSVHAVDFRGHGRSSGRTGQIGRMSALVDDLDRLRAYAATQHPDAPVFLLGHSLGAMVVLEYLLTDRPRPAGAVLSGVGIDVSGIPAAQARVARLLSAVAPNLGLVALDSSGISRDPAVVAAYDADPLVFRGKVPVRTAAELLISADRVEPRLAEITVPILVLHGGSDAVANPAGAHLVHDGVASPDRTLHVVEGAYHEIFNEPERDEILDSVIEWIGRGADVRPAGAADRHRAGDAAWAGSRWNDELRDAVIAGRRMRYLDVGTGPAILFVHGLGASWQVWYKTIPDLVDDHRVIAVDLPGFGRSQSLRRAADIASYAEALRGLLEHIGLERVVVVGHSLGGLIIQRLATLAPDLVGGLVLVSTADGKVGPRQEAAFRGAAAISRTLRVFGPPPFVLRPAVRTVLAVPTLRRRLLGRAVHDPADIPGDLAAYMMMSVYRSPALADAIRAGLSHADRLDPRLVPVPTLIISGDRDRMVPPTAATRLARDIPRADHEVWTDVGHHPMLEQPERFNARVRGAVARFRS